jgi:hypothetical protein
VTKTLGEADSMKTRVSLILKGILRRIGRESYTYEVDEGGKVVAHAPAHYREIYFVYPCTCAKRLTPRVTRKCFFERYLGDMDEVLAKQPIFFDRQHALKYSRFVADNFGVIKAYVSERAIHATGRELFLKPGSLAKRLIHGYYPRWGHGRAYITNPAFDGSGKKSALE